MRLYTGKREILSLFMLASQHQAKLRSGVLGEREVPNARVWANLLWVIIDEYYGSPIGMIIACFICFSLKGHNMLLESIIVCYFRICFEKRKLLVIQRVEAFI